MKTPTSWSENPANEANEYTYNSLVYMFDSATQNYDGVVDNDLKDHDILPAVWSRQSKSASSWVSDTSNVPFYDSASDSYDMNVNYDGTIDTNHKNPTVWRAA